jgi:hypothetical protein
MQPVAVKPPNHKLRRWVKNRGVHCPGCGRQELWREPAVHETTENLCRYCKTVHHIQTLTPEAEDIFTMERLRTEP